MATTPYSLSFFFNATATTEIYTLSLHDALPICDARDARSSRDPRNAGSGVPVRAGEARDPELGAKDRKSTRLNSSHVEISYAVFCLKKKNNRRPSPGCLLC